MSSLKNVAIILCSGLCTFGIIAIPFLIFRDNKKPPEIISYLGEKSTSAIMAILVVYCLKGAVNSDFISNLTLFGGVATTVITHLIFKNTLLSVFVGTVCYMIFIRIA